MTVYQMMTIYINSLTESATKLEKAGNKSDIVRGMIRGVELVRDELTIEAAGCEC